MTFVPDWGYSKSLPVDVVPVGWGWSFKAALGVVAPFEGGDVDHPSDPGGKTRWGITQATFRAWLRSRRDPLRGVETMSSFEAASIYRERYWVKGQCVLLPTAAGIAHFDAMVQHGPGGAGRSGAVGATHLLQRALGVDDDGIIGPRTSRALRSSAPGLVEHALWERALHYWRILDNRPDLRTFSHGWRNRVEHLRAEALKHVSDLVSLPPIQPISTIRVPGRPLPLPRDVRRTVRRAA